ncbi:MAG: cyclic nucleotide-binding domain-containing protein, partial [Spirochaetota bacterium]
MPESRSFKSGDILFVQGGIPERIYFMIEGELEVLSAPREYIGLDDGIIIDKSVRVCTLKGKAMLMGFSDLLTSPFTKSVRAIAPSRIVEYPLSNEGFNGIAERDIPGSINMLRQLFNLFLQSQNQLKKVV